MHSRELHANDGGEASLGAPDVGGWWVVAGAGAVTVGFLARVTVKDLLKREIPLRAATALSVTFVSTYSQNANPLGVPSGPLFTVSVFKAPKV